MSEAVGAEEARRLIAGGEAKAIDARGDEAWREHRITGATRLSGADLDAEIERVPEDVRLIVVGDEEQGPELADQLNARSRDAAYLEGGLDAWIAEDYPVQPSEDPEDEAVI